MNENNDGMQLDVVIDPTEELNDYYNPRELIIFAIECTDSMFQSSSTVDDSSFRTSLRCCRSVLMKKIIGSSSDCIGILFYGTREKDRGEQYPKYVITFSEPNQASAEVIRKIDLILKSSSNNNFDSNYGHSDDYFLSDVLWRCSSLIGRSTVKINVKKVILMTCNDFPHRNSVTKQHQVRKKCEDFASLNITLEVIAMKEDFDGKLFYNEILVIINGEESKMERGDILIQELQAGSYRKDHKKRSLGKLSWTIGEGIKLGVELYCFYRHLSIPPVRKLHKKTNEIVRSVTQTYHAETCERLLKSDLNQKIVIGDQELTFGVDEKERLDLLEKPGIILLGFKSLVNLNPEYHVQTASFLFPDEEVYKGSTKLFKALLGKCLAKDKFALCYMVGRARSKPKLVALKPQNEIVDENKDIQVMPAGFHVIYFPYAEYVRNVELPTKKVIRTDEIQLCKQVLKKVKLDYSVRMFENPKIQTHWANIEALALNYTERRDVEDCSMPNYDFVSECRLKDLEKQFIKTFYRDNYDPEAEAARKRKYSTYMTHGTATKMPRVEQSVTDNVIKMAMAGQTEKLTVDVLKQFLKEKGVHVSGFKKNNLIEALHKELDMNF